MSDALPSHEPPPDDPPAAAAVAAVLAAVPEDRPPPQADAGRGRRALAFSAALALHLGALFAHQYSPDSNYGGGGTEVDALSVTLVDAAVLESRDLSKDRPDAAPAAETVAATDGSQAPPAVTPPPEPAPPKQAAIDPPPEPKPPEPPQTVDKPAPLPAFKTETIAEAVVEPPPAPKTEAEPKKDPKRVAEARPPEPPPQPAGGAASRANTAASGKTASAPAVARAGELQAYARRVSEALAARKPVANGELGSVQIGFLLSPGGKLVATRILVSSGRPNLDAQALKIIRSVPFPQAPAGVASDELSFRISYHFK